MQACVRAPGSSLTWHLMFCPKFQLCTCKSLHKTPSPFVAAICFLQTLLLDTKLQPSQYVCPVQRKFSTWLVSAGGGVCFANGATLHSAIATILSVSQQWWAAVSVPGLSHSLTADKLVGISYTAIPADCDTDALFTPSLMLQHWTVSCRFKEVVLMPAARLI